MSDKPSTFTVAILATEKAIAAKRKKLKQVKADYALAIDYEQLWARQNKINFDLGYYGELATQGKGIEKNDAKKRVAELTKEDKRLKNIDGVKLIDAEIKLENEIEILTSELRALNNLSHRNPRYIM